MYTALFMYRMCVSCVYLVSCAGDCLIMLLYGKRRWAKGKGKSGVSGEL